MGESILADCFHSTTAAESGLSIESEPDDRLYFFVQPLKTLLPHLDRALYKQMLREGVAVAR